MKLYYIYKQNGERNEMDESQAYESIVIMVWKQEDILQYLDTS